MKFLKAVAGLGFAMSVSVGAMAADYSVDYVAPASTPINWDGFYAGVGVVGAGFSRGSSSGTNGFVDVVIGANGVADNILYGVEVTVGGYVANTGSYGPGFGAEGRVGYIVIPEAVIYGAVGGYAFGPGAVYGYVGAGVEYAMTDKLSFDLEYKYYGVSNNRWSGHGVGAQALWHF